MKTISRAISLTGTALFMLCAGHCLQAGNAVWAASSGLLPTNASPPWLFYPEPTYSVTLVSGDLRLETSGIFARATYFQESYALSIPTNFIIEARVRFVSGSSSVSGEAPAGISFYPQQGVANRLWIGRDEIFVNAGRLFPGGPLQRGAVAKVETDDSFHDYRIEVHGITNGSSFEVFYDGALTLTGSLFLDDEDQEPEIGWGDLSYDASGVSEWQSFRHNASAALTISIFTAAEICWASETNRLYQVQWASSLPATNWMDFGASVAGRATNICVFDSTCGSARRFYRVEIVL